MRPAVSSPRSLPRACVAAAFATLVFAGVLGSSFVGVEPAHADNELVSSNPAEGSSVESSPTSITLTFASPVGAKNTVVATCNGTQVPIGNPAVSPDSLTLTVAVVNAFPKGSCNVTYLVAAPDGTPNGSATFGFSVLNDPPAGAPTTLAPTSVAGSTTLDPGTAATATAASDPTATTVAGAPAGAPGSATATSSAPNVGGPLGLARLLASLGLATLLGSLVLIAVAWPEGIEYILTVRFLRWTWVVALVGSVLTVVFLTARVSGRSVGAALSPTAWTDLTDTTPGVAALCRLAAAAACGWTVIRPERTVDPSTQLPAMALPVIAVATLGFSRTGGDLALIGVLAGIGHVLAMSVWVGGLLLLTRVVLAGPGEEDLVHAVRGYSRLSGPALTITVLTGAIQIYRLDRGSLFDTGHGRLLLVKALIVGGMVFVGLVTRQFVRSAVKRTDVMTPPLASRLRRATGIEALGGVVVLALSAWLLALVPGGLAADTADAPSYASQTVIASGDLSLTVSVTGTVGENGVLVEVTQPATGLTSLVIRFIPPEGTAAPQVDLTVPPELGGAGVAVLPEEEGVPLLVAGTWTLRVDAITSAGPQSVSRSFFLVS